MDDEPLKPAVVRVVGLSVTGATNLTATLHLNLSNMLVLERRGARLKLPAADE